MERDLTVNVEWRADGVEGSAVAYVPLRPLFAGLAMNGLLASGIKSHLSYDDLADVAGRHADAQLERLDEKPQAGESAE